MTLRARQRGILWLVIASASLARIDLRALTLLTYNVNGNGAADWSTNSVQVQAIGRQVAYLRPDVVTFNEIPFTNSWQMTNFVRAWLPGYFLARYSGTDGYIRSVIASRFPILREASWLDSASLNEFGYAGRFTRDLFEAEIQVPDYPQPLHVFTTHLKAGTSSSDLARRGAEAGAISNFLVRVFRPQHAGRTYVLTGDLNEDVAAPRPGSALPIQRLANPQTDLWLTTPRNPYTQQDYTISIRSSLFARYDYILPCGLLGSNLLDSAVFRSDLLQPTPPGLLAQDSRTASDHLPVWAEFRDPYEVPFRLIDFRVGPGFVRLRCQTQRGWRYRVESSSTLREWTTASSLVLATNTLIEWNLPASGSLGFFRVRRLL